ncbi:copper amine oxidase N-terminal domain-containing protein [Pseudobacteroides cellulosolvens]|uniref:Copper amine oxidase-like domain-containing protein n=1 Tax=Pseudobacteroides cellulosolvens ATCC 35603 = DSM 2933 TaxID=398512 RepID=A0A0L6JY66_9FIRM|nr:copper amine oxidase N-terminal domain-containing protein [Pseudobacteroides cellulosolvens]KNY30402.1 copper amine oxidase-like domain-containing protein [Pseudobacteroides cellulosolvens ATCC 35603 = DSM 2933]
MKRLHDRIRQVLIFLIIIIMCSSMTANICTAETTSGSDEIKVFLNSERLQFDVNPYIKNSRTLVPFRKIFEAFGLEVQWNPANQTVVATGKGTEIYLEINNKVAYVNDLKKTLDTPPEITGGRTFVPLRFVGESIGAVVDWNSKTKTISITYANSSTEIGQTVNLGEIKLSIDKVDVDYEGKTYLVTGKVNSDIKNLYIYLYEDSDKYIFSKVKILEKNGEFFDFESGRHQPLDIKKVNYICVYEFSDSGEKVKVAEYQNK